MTWFRVDDKFAFHPKAVRAGNEAVGAWVRLGAWSSDQMTDGEIPTDIAMVIANGKQDVLDQLVTARLLVPVEAGYQMHDFLDWNPSAKQLKRQRKADAERKRGLRAPSGKRPAGLRSESGSPDPDPDPDPRSQKEDPPVAPPRGAPTQQGQIAITFGPSETSEPGKGSKGSRKRAPLVPEDPTKLTGRVREVYDAVAGDPSLQPITVGVVQLAHDLCAIGPAVDVAIEVRKAGAWMRADPKDPRRRKRSGNAFLVNWITSAQEKAAAQPTTAPAADGWPRKPAPEPGPIFPTPLPPPRPKVNGRYVYPEDPPPPREPDPDFAPMTPEEEAEMHQKNREKAERLAERRRREAAEGAPS